ncbi:uncharacterized protein LOC135842856 [Planococcus citri]|uniref:uncharacterized protein LOC135842856 n=1 Tax=Planococcus citri TaxID=170843 RepID=UPI0031FA25C7
MRVIRSKESFLSRLRLILLSFIIVSPALIPGFTYGYASIALPQLRLNLSDASWFGSFSIIGCFFGSLASGYIIDKHGRKACLVVSIIPSVIGWYCLSREYTPFLGNTGRFLTGLTSGATSYASSVYLAECIVRHRLKVRSSFATWSAVAITFGVCVVYILGSFLPCETVALIFAILSLIFGLLLVVFIPESPIWLYQKGRIGDAEYAMKYLRLYTLISEIEEKPNLAGDVDKSAYADGALGLLRRKDVYKPLIMTTTLLCFSMLSGGMVLVTYMVDTIKTKTIDLESAYQYANLSGVLQFLISASIAFILPYTGNRKPTLFSGFGMAIGMALIAVTSSIENVEYQREIDIARAISVIFCISMFSFGYLTLPGALLGEVFPVEAQGLASIPSLLSFLVNCTTIKAHLWLYTSHGGGIFYFYAFVNVIGTIVVYFVMPETVGRTLEEIRNDFL